MHHQCKKMHPQMYQYIINATSVYHQCTINAPTMHHQCTSNAPTNAPIHHQCTNINKFKLTLYKSQFIFYLVLHPHQQPNKNNINDESMPSCNHIRHHQTPLNISRPSVSNLSFSSKSSMTGSEGWRMQCGASWSSIKISDILRTTTTFRIIHNPPVDSACCPVRSPR